MNASSAVVRKQAAILNRLFKLRKNGIGPEAAQQILDIDFDQIDVDRMHELSLKAQRGALTPSEDLEADFYSTWGNLLGVLHSKARLALKKRGLPVRVSSLRFTPRPAR